MIMILAGFGSSPIRKVMTNEYETVFMAAGLGSLSTSWIAYGFNANHVIRSGVRRIDSV